MDFLQQWFHISPDEGSRLLETLYAVTVLPIASARPSALQPGLIAQLIGGVAVDGGGWVIVGGYPHPIPPSGPATAILRLLAANALVAGIENRSAHQIEQMIFSAISEIASQKSKAQELPGPITGQPTG